MARRAARRAPARGLGSGDEVEGKEALPAEAPVGRPPARKEEMKWQEERKERPRPAPPLGPTGGHAGPAPRRAGVGKGPRPAGAGVGKPAAKGKPAGVGTAHVLPAARAWAKKKKLAPAQRPG